MFRRKLLASLGAAFLLAPSGDTAPQKKETRPNVILITIDTLRADYLGCYGNRKIATPALDALAADGTLFERAYCQVPMTPPSHASILTGAYPPTHGVRDFTSPPLKPGFPTLPGKLKKIGYKTAAFVSAYVLDAQWGLNQGFDLYYDRFDPREFLAANPGNVQRRAEETIDLVLSWLDREGKNPYFLWVHLFDPHHDYNPPQPYRSRYRDDLYGGEVAYTDHQVGRLILELKRRGEYAKDLIIVTSDHGEAFGEHNEADHGFFIYNTTTHIPLIIKLPETTGRGTGRVKGIAETVDIAPTVAQILEVRSAESPPMQGRGLLGQILGKELTSSPVSYSETLYPRKTFGWSELASYIEGKFKYIDAPRPELYDLSLDPNENQNLYPKQRAVAERLRESLTRFRNRVESTGSVATAAVDPGRLENLRALGYVAVSVPMQKKAGQDELIDPKDRVHDFNKVRLALQAAEAGAMEKSNALLDELARADPQLFVAHYSLGLNKLKMGEIRQSLEHFTTAKALNPSFELTDIARAMALAQLGQLDQAIETLSHVIRQNPASLPAKRRLAALHSRKRDFARAIETYRDILSMRPQDPAAAKSLGIALVESREYKEGSQTLKNAITLGADDAVAHNFLGIALINLGQLQEGIEAYRKALALKADYHQARLNLSFALLKADRTAEAVKEYSTLCQQNRQLCRQYEKYFR